MRLAISNIAWNVEEDEAVVAILHRYGIEAIDIAPGKYFPDPSKASLADIEQVRNWWAIRGIEITGMQALLFGTTGLNVFGTSQSRVGLMAHLGAICRIGDGLGASRIVFGSPKNRDRGVLTDEETLNIAVPFFSELGDIALASSVTICLEPNPTCYGANFMTTSAETARVVRSVAHPAIKMQFDTGALTINGEDPRTVLCESASIIGHVHASERDLVPLGDGDTDHKKMSAALLHYLPDHVLSIEMVATKGEPHIQSIARAIQTAIRDYKIDRIESGL